MDCVWVAVITGLAAAQQIDRQVCHQLDTWHVATLMPQVGNELETPLKLEKQNCVWHRVNWLLGQN